LNVLFFPKMNHLEGLRGEDMQILVVFLKSDRKVIATFELKTIITEMNVLKIPEVDYLVTSKRDIFYTAPNGQVFIKDM
jgi:hypothetical protein